MLPINFDSRLGNNVEYYISVLRDLGFVRVLSIPFKIKGRKEKMYSFFNKEFSILICFDTYTYGEPIVNKARMYYNWSQDADSEDNWFHGCVYQHKKSTSYPTYFNKDWQAVNESDIGLDTAKDFKDADKIFYKYIDKHECRCVIIGDDDALEGIRTKLKRLVDNGIFLKKWVEKPFVWLIHYGDEADQSLDLDRLNKERISALPPNVKKQIVNTNI